MCECAKIAIRRGIEIQSKIIDSKQIESAVRPALLQQVLEVTMRPLTHFQTPLPLPLLSILLLPLSIAAADADAEDQDTRLCKKDDDDGTEYIIIPIHIKCIYYYWVFLNKSCGVLMNWDTFSEVCKHDIRFKVITAFWIVTFEFCILLVFFISLIVCCIKYLVFHCGDSLG